MASDKKNVSPLQLWLEDAWEGWIRPLGLILLIAIGYLLYRFDLIGERVAGVALVLAVVAGAIGTGVWPALALARAPWQRALLLTMTAAALAGTLYPSLRAAVPAPTLIEGVLTADKLSATLKPGQPGPYDVTVSSHFKEAGRSDAEATYTIKAGDNGGGSDEVSGAIKRQLKTIRSRKGSSSFMAEHNESTHRLPHVVGPEVTLTTDGVDDQLEGGLQVALRRGSFNPVIFLLLGALALAMALVLDTRLVDVKGKAKSYLTASVAIAYVFSVSYPREATPHASVRPGVSEFLFALFVGGLGGWALGGVARVLFGPKIKKAPAKR